MELCGRPVRGRTGAEEARGRARGQMWQENRKGAPGVWWKD